MNDRPTWRLWCGLAVTLALFVAVIYAVSQGHQIAQSTPHVVTLRRADGGETRWETVGIVEYGGSTWGGHVQWHFWTRDGRRISILCGANDSLVVE